MLSIPVTRHVHAPFTYGWNRGADAVTYHQLHELTSFVVNAYGLSVFRPYLMAMRLSWLVHVEGPHTLLACLSLAYATMGPLYDNRACGKSTAPFGCDVPGKIAEEELRVLKGIGCLFPPVPAEWSMYEPLASEQRGQSIAMYLWTAEGVSVDEMMPMCMDYEKGVRNSRLLDFFPVK